MFLMQQDNIVSAHGAMGRRKSKKTENKNVSLWIVGLFYTTETESISQLTTNY